MINIYTNYINIYCSNIYTNTYIKMNSMRVKITPYPVVNTPRDNNTTTQQSRYEKWKHSRKGNTSWRLWCCFSKKKQDKGATEPLYIP